MAEGIMNHVHGHKYQAFSAGVNQTSVHPLAITSLQEIDIDISNQYSKSIGDLKGIEFDYVVTLCDKAREICPYVDTDGVVLHKSFKDPAAVKGSFEDQIEAFRNVRDEIKEWLAQTFEI